MSAKIIRGDRVQVLSGKEKGRQGDVIKVLVEEGKAIVQGLNLSLKHEKPRAANEGGRIRKEMPLHPSSLALLDPKDDKPVRVGFRMVEGKKVRFAKRSGEVIEYNIKNKKSEKK